MYLRRRVNLLHFQWKVILIFVLEITKNCYIFPEKYYDFVENMVHPPPIIVHT